MDEELAIRSRLSPIYSDAFVNKLRQPGLDLIVRCMSARVPVFTSKVLSLRGVNT